MHRSGYVLLFLVLKIFTAAQESPILEAPSNTSIGGSFYYSSSYLVLGWTNYSKTIPKPSIAKYDFLHGTPEVIEGSRLSLSGILQQIIVNDFGNFILIKSNNLSFIYNQISGTRTSFWNSDISVCVDTGSHLKSISSFSNRISVITIDSSSLSITEIKTLSEKVAVAYDAEYYENNLYLVGKAVDFSTGTKVFVSFSDSQTVWSKYYGTTGDDVGLGVTADSDRIYVVGKTSGSFYYHESLGDFDVILMSCDFNGNLKWTTQFGSSGRDIGSLISLYNGYLYVLGTTSMLFGDEILVGESDENSNSFIFLSKFSTTGKLISLNFMTAEEGELVINAYVHENDNIVLVTSKGVFNVTLKMPLTTPEGYQNPPSDNTRGGNWNLIIILSTTLGGILILVTVIVGYVKYRKRNAVHIGNSTEEGME